MQGEFSERQTLRQGEVRTPMKCAVCINTVRDGEDTRWDGREVVSVAISAETPAPSGVLRLGGSFRVVLEGKGAQILVP